MYFTIIEPPQTQAAIQRLAKIKERMSALGIAGEFAMLENAGQLESLFSQAVGRKYNTVVLLAGTKTLAAALRTAAHQGVVVGVIPESFNTDASELIGVHNLEESLIALQKRRWVRLPVITIQESLRTVTPVTIPLAHDQEVHITSTDWELSATGGIITLEADYETGAISATHTTSKKTSLWKRLLNTKSAHDETRVFSTSLRIESASRSEVLIDGASVSELPLSARVDDTTIKLIVSGNVAG